MSRRIVLAMPAAVRTSIWTHMFSDRRGREEAAFVFARPEVANEDVVFRHIEWRPVRAEGFVFRTAAHFELADTERAAVIKRAHDLDASLIEFHSHTGSWPAAFSPSDIEGFRAFVPHVWWRLKGRPYVAVVVSRTGFDAFVWMTDPQSPRMLDGIESGTELLAPTGLSQWDHAGDLAERLIDD